MDAKTGDGMNRVLSLVAIASFCVLMQIRVLPPHGFLSGDQGSKYLQARAFAARGPLRPGIEVRSRDLDPEYHHQEPKLKNRHGRLVSEFLWLLPLTTAPFLAALGVRGIYVVPALSVLIVFLAAVTIGRRVSGGSGLVSGWCVVAATPVLLYGLEFWEHAPAAACVLVAAALLGPWTPVSARWRLAGAGAVIVAGALFREEALPALPALILARAWSMPRNRRRDLIIVSAWAALGAALVAAAAVPVNLLLYGSPLPMHMTQDAWAVARATPFMEVRRQVLFDLLLPKQFVALYVLAVLAGCGAALARARGMVWTGLLPIVHASAAVLLCLGVAIPLARHDYLVSSAAHTWPFAVALLYWPWASERCQRDSGRFLIVAGFLLLLLAAIIVPTSGGAQWSPRFLLAVAPLLAIVAAAIAGRDGAPSSTAWMARLALAASLLMQISGIVYLRDAKERNARITDQVRALVPADEPVIADAYWLPEVLATLAPERRILFAWSPAQVGEIAGIVAAGGYRNVSVIASVGETGYVAPRVVDVPGCAFTRNTRLAIGERGLIIHRYACAEAPVVK